MTILLAKAPLANYRKKHIARSDGVPNSSTKILSWFHTSYVKKHSLNARRRTKPITYPTGIRSSIVPPVANEDRRHNSQPHEVSNKQMI